MASCTSCKKRTTSFCFKHKAAVCDDCIVQPLHPQLVSCQPCDPFGNYFDWLTSGEYEWPQRCGVCNRSVGTGDGEEAKRAVVRLVCKCLYHRGCLYEHLSNKKQPDPAALLQDDRSLRCLNCSAPIYDPAVQGKSKLRESVVHFLRVVDAQEGAYSELTETEQMPAANGHKHHSTQPTTLQPTAFTSQTTSLTSAAAPIPSNVPTSLSSSAPSPAVSTSTSSPSAASSITPTLADSNTSTPPSSVAFTTALPSPSARMQQSHQPSRQRSTTALLSSSSSSSSAPNVSSASAVLDIDEKQPLMDSDRQYGNGAGRRTAGIGGGGGSSSSKRSKGRRCRLDRLIAWLMIGCFVGSVVLYAFLSSQWADKARISRTGR